MLLLIPKIKPDTAKNNFVFQASCVWNEVIPKVMNKCYPNSQGIMVPGSNENSDLSTSISVIKIKLRDALINTQKICPPCILPRGPKCGDWIPENFFQAHYPV